MRHYFSRRIKILLAIALLVTVLLGVAVSITGKEVPNGFLQTLLTPLRSGAYALTSQVERLYNYVYSYDALAAENEQLKAQLAALLEEARQADSLDRENERLRQLLELLEANEDYRVVDAYVIARSSADWKSTITINRGTKDGVEVGMCVITSNKEVVGRVTEVGSNFAVVKTVLDSTLEISAAISSTGDGGVVSGGYATGFEGFLRMDYLPSSAIIRSKDQVVTAGSTQYPRNLILGHVVDAGFNDVGLAKFAIVEPAADVGSLEQVFVLTAFDKE